MISSLEKVLWGTRFFTVVVVHAMYQKSQQTRHTKTIVYDNFQFFQPLKITFMTTCDFYRYDHIYTYRRKESQNILERKLCNCFGQLLLVYSKKDEHGIEHNIEDMNLTVCYFVILWVSYLFFYGETNILLNLGGSRIVGSIGIKWGIGFKWYISYCENLSYKFSLVLSQWHIFSLIILKMMSENKLSFTP